MKYGTLLAAAALCSRPSDGQVIVWDNAPTSVLPERRTKDTQVALDVPELNGTMQQLFADVSSLKTGLATASSKVAALSAKVQPPAQVPSGMVAASPAPAAVVFRADRREDGLPEQGFEGEDVEHEDGETKTDDWGEEYGPESRDEDNAKEKHVAMHSKTRGAHRHRSHRRHHKHIEEEDGLPEQGFEGEDVEHEDGETKTDDWGEEYGPESDGFHPDDADEQDAAEDQVAMHVKAGVARHRGQHRRQVDDPEGLPEQGFEGEDVAHEDGETQTDDFGQEYGPDSEGADDQEEGSNSDLVLRSEAKAGHGHARSRQRGHGRRHSRGRGRKHLPARREAHEDQKDTKEAPSFLQSKAAPAREYYAPWFGAPGNAPSFPDQSIGATSGGGFPVPGAAVVEEAEPRQEAQSGGAERKESFLQRNAAVRAAPEAREYYAPWFGAPGNAPEAPASSASSSGGGFPLPGAATVAEPQQPEQGFEGEDVEHKDGETYTGDWQEEHGQTTEEPTEAPATTTVAP